MDYSFVVFAIVFLFGGGFIADRADKRRKVSQ